MAYLSDDEKERTLFIANLSTEVTDELLYELIVQAAPIEKISLLKDKAIAFVALQDLSSIAYCSSLLDGVRLFGKAIKIQPRSGTKQALQFEESRRNNSSRMSQGESRGRYDRKSQYSMAMPHLQQSMSVPPMMAPPFMMMNGQSPQMFGGRNEFMNESFTPPSYDRRDSRHRNDNQSRHYSNDRNQDQLHRSQGRNEPYGRRDDYRDKGYSNERRNRDRRN